MLFIWFFAGALLLFLLQRAVYRKYWDRGLRCRVSFPADSAEAGRDVRVISRVENRKLLPLPMLRTSFRLERNFASVASEGGAKPTVAWQAAIPARKSVRSETVLSGLPRGLYTVADLQLRAADLFYAPTRTRTELSFARFTVYPAKLPAQALQLPFRQLLGSVLTRQQTQEDPFEIRNIRPYEVTDSMRLINWKASARTGELKVNQHDHTTDEALLLIVDGEHGDLEDREAAISLASSLAELFLRRGVPVALETNIRSCLNGRAVSVPAGSGGAHRKNLDAALATCKLEAELARSFSELLEALRLRPRRAMPVVISAAPEAIGGALPGLGRGWVLRAQRDPAEGYRAEPLSRRTEAAG